MRWAEYQPRHTHAVKERVEQLLNTCVRLCVVDTFGSLGGACGPVRTRSAPLIWSWCSGAVTPTCSVRKTWAGRSASRSAHVISGECATYNQIHRKRASM